MTCFDAQSVHSEIVTWIRNWFANNGPQASAVIGISGGKDSTITAALLTEALGKDRVFGVMMPQGRQSDIDDSKRVVNILGIESLVVNIESTVNELFSVIPNLSRDAAINTPPRIRMTTLYAIAASLPNGGRVANTCNLSEDYIGYSTKYGDGAGDFAPLAGLTVQEVLAIGDTIEYLPKELVHKVPSDGLCGATDEDRFGFTYKVLDRYIRDGICEDASIQAKIDRMHLANEHKLKVIPAYRMKNELFFEPK